MSMMIASSALGQNPSGLINFADLRGVDGYPQWDSLSICGNCDTISLYLITESQDPITDGKITVNLPDGMEYCGSVGSTTVPGVVEYDVTDSQHPIFSIPTMNSGNGVPIWFTVSTDCIALETLFDDNDNELDIDYRMDYVHLGVDKFDVFYPIKSFNNAVFIPVLNILSIENQDTLGNPIGILGVPTYYQQKATISQNGLNAFLNEFILRVDYVDNAHSFYKMRINGVDVTSKVSDDGDLLQVVIDGSDFINNPDTVHHALTFDEDEYLELEVVWFLDFCEDHELDVDFHAFYSCNGALCAENTDDERSSRVTVDGPDFNVSLTAAGNHPTVSLCAERTRNLTINNNTTHVSSEIFNVGIEFNTTNLCDFSNAYINGVSVYDGYQLGTNYSSSYSILSLEDLLTSDPDGSGVGLEDLDNDGFYDDIPNGQSVTILFETVSSCEEINQYIETSNSCARVNCVYRPSARVVYDTDCTELNYTNFKVAWSIQSQYFSNYTFFGSFPPNASQGDALNLNFNVRFYNSYASPASSCSKYSVEFAMPLANGVVFNSATWGGVAIPADSISIIDDTLRFRSLPINRTNVITNTPLNLNLTNTICINDIVDWQPEVYLHCEDNVLTDCECRIPLVNTPEASSCTASNSTVRLGCTCDWIGTTKWDIQRTSFGWTDKTMTSRVDENTPGVMLDNFISCDSFKLEIEGVVKRDGYDSLKVFIGQWDAPQNSSYFIPDTLTATFEVIDGTNGNVIPDLCSQVTNPEETTFTDPFIVRTIRGWEIDLSDCLTQPLNNGDTVRIKGVGIVKNYTSYNYIEPDIFESYFMVYDTTSGIEKYVTCNALNDPIKLRQFGVYSRGNIDFEDFCFGEFKGYVLPGINASNPNPDIFPNEFRNMNHLDSIQVFSRGLIDESSFYLSLGGEPPVQFMPIHKDLGYWQQYTFIIDDMLCTDFLPANDTVAWFTFEYKRYCAANDQYRTDAGTYFRTYFAKLGNLEVDPNCKVSAIAQAYSVPTEITIENAPAAPASLALTVSPELQTATDLEFCFDAVISNAGSSPSYKTWIGLQNLSQSAEYISATRSDGVILNIQSWGDSSLNQALIDLDTSLNVSESVLIEVCIRGTACGLDSIEFFAGWDCSQFPEDILPSQYTGYQCEPEMEVVYYEILDPQIQLSFREPDPSIVPYCSPSEYILEIKNTRQGPALLDSVFFYFPLGDGLRFVPGTFAMAWPENASYVSIPDPVETGESNLFMGTQFVITDLDPPLGPDQVLPGIDLDPSNSILRIKFEAVPACGYHESSIMRFQASGHNICDELITSNLNHSPKIHLLGADTILTNEYLIFAEPSIFTTCSEMEIFEVIILNDGVLPTSPAEKVCITIPSELPLVNGSINFLSPDNWQPNITLDTVGYGIYQYCFNMPAGVPVGGLFKFEFEVDVDASKPCGQYPFLITTLYETELVCEYFESIEDCNYYIETSLNSEFAVNLVNSLSAIDMTVGYDFSVGCGISDTSGQVIYSMKVMNNNPVEDFPANQAAVRIYNDVNSNGILDFGTDIEIHSRYIAQMIPAGGMIFLSDSIPLSFDELCGSTDIIVELSDNAGCECGSEYTSEHIVFRDIFEGMDSQLFPCSNSAYAEYDIYCTDNNITSLFDDEYFYYYTDNAENIVTDGQGNVLVQEDYGYYSYFDISGDSNSLYVYFDFSYNVCSPDGVFLINIPIEIGGDPNCIVYYQFEVTCPEVQLLYNPYSEYVICDIVDSLCVNLIDYIEFYDTDNNPVSFPDSANNLTIDVFDYFAVYNQSGALVYSNNMLDTIPSWEDFEYEICLKSDTSIRYYLNGSCYQNGRIQFFIEDGDPDFSFELSTPDEICLGEEAKIYLDHTGIFEGIGILSGDFLHIPVCKHLNICDTICVSPLVQSEYEIMLTDSSGCRHDTIFDIGVRDTDAPLIIDVDDNVLCDMSETAQICIVDSRPQTIFTWQKDGIDIPGTTGQTCISVNDEGIYSITAEDDLGCELSGETEIFIVETLDTTYTTLWRYCFLCTHRFSDHLDIPGL